MIFFLDYLGEGHVNYWYNGQLNPELGLGYNSGLASYTYENCGSNGGSDKTCSLKKLQPEKEFVNEWWVKIKTSAGQEGWTLNTGQFSNVDACG